SNALDGTDFELVNSGSLTIDLGSTVYGDVLVANSDDVEVLRVRLNAADDELQVKDLYFDNEGLDSNAIENRVDFKLYNEAGQLIQQKQMTGGSLHFELANQDRITVPKDESTYVTVKVDVRDINRADQTGKRLQLDLDTTMPTSGTSALSGVEAVTAATGSDLATANITENSVTGQVFVAYRTQIMVDHAASQNFSGTPSAESQEVYRFTVTTDAARQAEIGRLNFSVSLSGMDYDGANTFAVYPVEDDGNVDTSVTVATTTIFENSEAAPATSDATEDGDTTANVFVTFVNQKLSAGDSKTYALFVDKTSDAGNIADDDAVSVSVKTDDGYLAPAVRSTQQGTVTGGDCSYKAAGSAVAVTNCVVWSDESSTSHNDDTLDWLNGYLLDIDTAVHINSD
ncbi:MAG: hypothetical protein K9M51_01350, partial [Candidatus Gracilibacteria bacterium]|nr:hypothetical protein [Candidatus Gracilibacteria bacterium]